MKAKVLFICAFWVILAVPFVGWFLGQDKFVTTLENRNLKQKPNFPHSTKEVKKFPKNVEDYYKDQFATRVDLLKAYRRAKSFIGDPITDLVVEGKEGWLYLGTVKIGKQRYSDPLGDYRGKNLYQAENLQLAVDRYRRLSAWLDKRGIEFGLVVAPQKHTVYPEYLPQYIQKLGKDTALDQLARGFSAEDDFRFIDLRSSMLKAKSNSGGRRIYHKHDSHWNSLGAEIAQYVIIKSFEDSFPGKVYARRYDNNVAKPKRGDLAKHFGIEYAEPDYWSPSFSNPCEIAPRPPGPMSLSTHVTKCGKGNLKILIFRDSYFTALLPYFSQQFSEAVFHWNVLTVSKMEELIEKHDPDLILEEYVERVLPRVPYLPGLPSWEEIERLEAQ